MSEGSGFLARWSRRKGEARVGRLEPSPERPHAEPADVLPPGEASPGPAAGREALEITPEEIAALPPIDELNAQSDYGAFLRRGVPDLLRKAALRRMWSTDPAIRDFVGEARDYAWDWNVVGGVPGHGPILPTDDMAATVRGIFGDDAPASEPIATAPSGSTRVPSVSEVDAPRPAPVAAAPPCPLAEPCSRPDAAEPDNATTTIARDGSLHPGCRSPVRRHGGAMPHHNGSNLLADEA